jgi:hypothetical protein
MRRWYCVLQIGVLVGVLWSGVASAAMTHFAPPPAVDLSARLYARLFGESTAPHGEAPFATPRAELVQLAQRLFAPADFLPAVVNLSDASFAPAPIKASLPQLSAQFHVPATAYYESVEPLPADAPASQRFDLSESAISAARGAIFAPSSFGATEPASGQDASSFAATGRMQLPVRLGRLRFDPHAEASFSAGVQSPFSDRSLGAGATLNLRAGARNLGVDVSSAVEHLTLVAPQFNPSLGQASPTIGLAGSDLPIFVPAYADVSAQTLSTGLNVPVTRSLTAHLQYDTQHLLGTYGASGFTGVDANNTIYGEQLTFTLPKKPNTAILFSAKQYRYQDNLVPASAAVTQNDADLRFIVKF